MAARTRKRGAHRFTPRVIRSGSVAVKIYRVTHPRTGFLYSVAWHAAGRRRVKQFADLGKAEGEARLKASQLAAGRIESASVTTAQLEMVAEARSIAGDVPLLAALEEWRKARTLAGPDVLRACESWAERNRGAVRKVVTVSAALKEFIAAKKKQGVDVVSSYGRLLRQRDPRTDSSFEKQFGELNLCDLRSRSLQAWLETSFVHLGTRNDHRRRAVTFFRWARKHDYLPSEVQTAAERTDRANVDDEQQEIGIITPETFRALLRKLASEHPHYVPAAVLAGFCGLRRGEVHGQDWKHIDLERAFVRVTAAKKKTPAHRLVPLCQSAIEWLMQYRKSTGLVCENLAIDRIRDIGRTAELVLPENCFRHTYISARVAETGDVNRISLDAGNSARKIFKHYRELMSKKEGEAWFAVSPDSKPSGNPKETVRLNSGEPFTALA